MYRIYNIIENMNKEIIKVINIKDLEYCALVRKAVFFLEENAPESLYIIDDLDKQTTTNNYLLKLNEQPIATVRFIKIDEITIKIQRLAVIKQYRNKGYAKELLQVLETDAIKLNYKKIILDSSEKAIKFYEKYNYKITSDLFYEDNRPHFSMQKVIK